MGEWLDMNNFQPPLHLPAPLPAYDALQRTRAKQTVSNSYEGFSPNSFYDSYMNIHKVLVGRKGGRKLIEISNGLKNEWLPDYLDAAGWAAAEASLVCNDMPTAERMELMSTAEACWQQALTNQSELEQTRTQEVLCQDDKELRLALNLAFTPLMKAFVAGTITQKIREQTFADTLALAQLSAVQLELASKENNLQAVASHIGFGYECNAHLSWLYVNDSSYLSIPSSHRADSGYEYRSQTHDITIINLPENDSPQFYPAEVKAAASLRDRKRYKALIIRAKMHLAVQGKYRPHDTTDAFARCFEGTPTHDDQAIVEHATSTVRDLLELYRQGSRPEEFQRIRTQTNFHESDILAQKYKELSTERRVS
jgi:hypothetical protein